MFYICQENIIRYYVIDFQRRTKTCNLGISFRNCLNLDVVSIRRLIRGFKDLKGAANSFFIPSIQKTIVFFIQDYQANTILYKYIHEL